MATSNQTPQSASTPQPLTSSLSSNSGRNCARRKPPSSASPTSSRTSYEENVRPSSLWSAEELTRLEDDPSYKELLSVQVLEGRGDVLVSEGLVPEEDITEIVIRFDDIPLEISALRSTTSPIPVDVVEDDGYSDDVATSSAHSDALSGKCGTIPGAAEASRGPYARHRPLTAKGPETLRERRMSYLRAMHAMSKSKRQEPILPPAILATSASVAGRPEWTIEAGTLRSRRGSTRRIPEFAARYGGSPIAYLRAQRDTIDAEVRRRRTDRLFGRASHPHVGDAASRVPLEYQEAYARERELDKLRQREIERKHEEPSDSDVERQRVEIAECLRSVDLDATSLDERSLQDVVEAVIAAAAEAAHVASSR